MPRKPNRIKGFSFICIISKRKFHAIKVNVIFTEKLNKQTLRKMKNLTVNSKLTVTRKTFLTDWSVKGTKGENKGRVITGTQPNQSLTLKDENGKVIIETSTPISNEGQIVNKIGWVAIRVSDNHIADKGWTVNEKSISRKWFKPFLKDGSYKVLTGRL